MAIGRYYNPKGKGTAPAGVPLRNLDHAEFSGYPRWLRAAIDASGLYGETPLDPQPGVVSVPDAPAPAPKREKVVPIRPAKDEPPKKAS